MKVLITGANGFIGSRLARLLVKTNFQVYALVRPNSNLSRIQDIVPQLELWHGDLLDDEKLCNYLEQIRPDICLHLAWYAVPGKYLEARENLGMLNASLNLATKLAEVGCQKFIGIGTCIEYDTAFGYLSEFSPIKPTNLYAASKLALQQLLTQWGKTVKMELAWIRLFYQYGPGEDIRRLIPTVICSLLQSKPAQLTRGEQIRDYLHVEDVAAAIWAVAKSNLSGVVNVGSGKPVTVAEMALTVAQILGKTDLLDLGAIPYRTGDPMFICANNQLLLSQTDWSPKYALEEGLANTIMWWRDYLKSEDN